MLYWEGMPGREQQGKGTQESCSHMALGLRFYCNQVICGYLPAIHLTYIHIWSDSLAAHTSLSLNRVQQKGISGDWQNILWAGISLLWPFPNSFPAVSYLEFLLLIDCLCFVKQRSSPSQIHLSQLTSTSTSIICRTLITLLASEDKECLPVSNYLANAISSSPL